MWQLSFCELRFLRNTTRDVCMWHKVIKRKWRVLVSKQSKQYTQQLTNKQNVDKKLCTSPQLDPMSRFRESQIFISDMMKYRKDFVKDPEKVMSVLEEISYHIFEKDYRSRYQFIIEERKLRLGQVLYLGAFQLNAKEFEGTDELKYLVSVLEGFIEDQKLSIDQMLKVLATLNELCFKLPDLKNKIVSALGENIAAMTFSELINFQHFLTISTGILQSSKTDTLMKKIDSQLSDFVVKNKTSEGNMLHLIKYVRIMQSQKDPNVRYFVNKNLYLCLLTAAKNESKSYDRSSSFFELSTYLKHFFKMDLDPANRLLANEFRSVLIEYLIKDIPNMPVNLIRDLLITLYTPMHDVNYRLAYTVLPISAQVMNKLVERIRNIIYAENANIIDIICIWNEMSLGGFGMYILPLDFIAKMKEKILENLQELDDVVFYRLFRRSSLRSETHKIPGFHEKLPLLLLQELKRRITNDDPKTTSLHPEFESTVLLKILKSLWYFSFEDKHFLLKKAVRHLSLADIRPESFNRRHKGDNVIPELFLSTVISTYREHLMPEQLLEIVNQTLESLEIHAIKIFSSELYFNTFGFPSVSKEVFDQKNSTFLKLQEIVLRQLECCSNLEEFCFKFRNFVYIIQVFPADIPQIVGKLQEMIPNRKLSMKEIDLILQLYRIVPFRISHLGLLARVSQECIDQYPELSVSTFMNLLECLVAVGETVIHKDKLENEIIPQFFNDCYKQLCFGKKVSILKNLALLQIYHSDALKLFFDVNTLSKVDEYLNSPTHDNYVELISLQNNLVVLNRCISQDKPETGIPWFLQNMVFDRDIRSRFSDILNPTLHEALSRLLLSKDFCKLANETNICNYVIDVELYQDQMSGQLVSHTQFFSSCLPRQRIAIVLESLDQFSCLQEEGKPYKIHYEIQAKMRHLQKGGYKVAFFTQQDVYALRQIANDGGNMDDFLQFLNKRFIK